MTPTQIPSQRVAVAGPALMSREWFRYFFAQFTKLNPTPLTVTQLTSKSTGVSLNAQKGQVVMNGAVLNAGASVTFILTNAFIEATDVVSACMGTGGTANAYTVAVLTVATGTVGLQVTNITGGNLTEAPVVNFEIGA